MSKGYRKMIDTETGKPIFIKKRAKAKTNPDTDKPKALIQAINKGQTVDKRTKAGRQISEVREAVQNDLDGTARALLEADVANAAVIQQACINAAYREPKKMIDPDGKPCQALYSWMKFACIKRSALLALKKFQPPKKQPKPAGDLGDMVLEVTATGTEGDETDDGMPGA